MRCWSIADLCVRSGKPQVLFASDDSCAIALRLGAGEQLADHRAHERAWIMPVSGEIEVSSAAGSPVRGGPGMVIELAAKERHQILAHEEALLLLVLSTWSGAAQPEAVPVAIEHPSRVRATDQARPADLPPSAVEDDDPWSLDPLSPLP